MAATRCHEKRSSLRIRSLGSSARLKWSRLKERRSRGGPEAWRDRADVLPLAVEESRPADGSGGATEGPGEGEREAEASSGGRRTEQADFAGGSLGDLQLSVEKALRGLFPLDRLP